MAAGMPSSGPYGRLRQLRQELKDYEYELRLIKEGHKRRLSRKSLEKLIADNRAAIKQINQALSNKKQA